MMHGGQIQVIDFGHARELLYDDSEMKYERFYPGSFDSMPGKVEHIYMMSRNNKTKFI